MSPALPRPAAATAGPAAEGAAAPAVARVERTDSLPGRLIAFAALGLFGAVHWGRFVEAAPTGRLVAAVAIATAAAAGLGVLGRHAPPTWRRQAVVALAVAIAVVALIGGLLAAGLPLRLLGTNNWDELADGLNRGMAGIQSASWPYAGADAWTRLVTLLGAPLLLTIAATLAFFPALRHRGALRAAGLVALLLLYGMPVTEHEPGDQLLRGLALLVLVAAWLWLPRLGTRDAALAAASVLVAGLAAIPIAAAMDTDRAWWDYGALGWFGEDAPVTFNWSHTYGPLDWTRDGTTLLNVRSNRPHYWKAETLDTFDGLRWMRSGPSSATSATSELPDRLGGSSADGWSYFEYNPRWDERIGFTVRSLSTNLVVGAGTVYDVDGVRATPVAGGTAVVDQPLERGDSYFVSSYAPDPTGSEMRGAPRGYPGDLLPYTTIMLPNPGENALQPASLRGDPAGAAGGDRPVVIVPPRGSDATGVPDPGRALLRSPYARVYRLAQTLTAGTPSAYDAVKSIENHLQRQYRYAERVPSQEYPLAAFLFEDRRGYCQQFSGAMALMLRMAGIPARVAAGFSPGSFNKDTGEYRVRDLDAHSWVEVYFTGIGWVPFDPTPVASPAESQSTGADATSAAAADAGEVIGGGEPTPAPERGTDTGAPAAGGGGGGGVSWVLFALAPLAALVAGVAWLTIRRTRAQGALSPAELADAQLRELWAALGRLGWSVPAGTTLLALEHRLARAAGPASASYAARLRAYRYDTGAPEAPDLAARRAVRRELSAHGGMRGRLRALLALPPFIRL